VVDNIGRVTFKPKDELNRGTQHSLSILPGISDNAGFMIQDTQKIFFKTSHEKYVSGTIVENFENVSSWQHPDSSSVTNGIDSILTTVARNSSVELYGTYCGEIAYTFVSDTGGICQTIHETGFNIGSNTESEFGIWIYSDFSYNVIELGFDFDGNTDVRVTVDSLKWFGWKMVKFPLSVLNPTGDVYFRNITIKQTSVGDITGTVYFDDAQYDIQTGVDANFYNSEPVQGYVLYQNYPNPFNPETTIRYSIPQRAEVSVKIFNLLGQEVVTLQNGTQNPGIYGVKWDAVNQPSGVYFVKVEAEGFVATKKLILLK